MVMGSVVGVSQHVRGVEGGRVQPTRISFVGATESMLAAMVLPSLFVKQSTPLRWLSITNDLHRPVVQARAVSGVPFICFYSLYNLTPAIKLQCSL